MRVYCVEAGAEKGNQWRRSRLLMTLHTLQEGSHRILKSFQPLFCRYWKKRAITQAGD